MNRWQDRRTWIAGTLALAILLTTLAYFFVISPVRDSTASLRDQTASVETQNDTLQAKTDKLRRQSSNLGGLTSRLSAALDALPADSGLPKFTREIRTLGTKSGIAIDSIDAAPPTLVQNGAGAGTTTTTPTTGQSTSVTTAAPAASSDEGATAGALYSIAVTVNTSGTMQQQSAFLAAVRTGARPAHVTTVSGSATTSMNGSAKFVTSMTIFSQPRTPQELAMLKRLLSGKLSN